MEDFKSTEHKQGEPENNKPVAEADKDVLSESADARSNSDAHQADKTGDQTKEGTGKRKKIVRRGRGGDSPKPNEVTLINQTRVPITIDMGRAKGRSVIEPFGTLTIDGGVTPKLPKGITIKG